MLKPADQSKSPPPERPIGDLVQQLTEEGKAYARAELGVAKAIAAAKARALALPAGLFGAVPCCWPRRRSRSSRSACSRPLLGLWPGPRRLRGVPHLRRTGRRPGLVRSPAAEARPVKDTPEIAAARIEAERARANMMATAQELQERVSPEDTRPRRLGRCQDQGRRPRGRRRRCSPRSAGRRDRGGCRNRPVPGAGAADGSRRQDRRRRVGEEAPPEIKEAD